MKRLKFKVTKDSSDKTDAQSQTADSASSNLLLGVEATTSHQNPTQEERAKLEMQRKRETANSCMKLLHGLFHRRSKINLDKTDENMEKSEHESLAEQLKSVTSFTKPQLFAMLDLGIIRLNSLEQFANNKNEAIKLRREYISTEGEKAATAILKFPNFEDPRAKTLKLQNFIGFIQIPLAVAGPFFVDRCRYFVPMATATRGLVSTVSRGMRACVFGVHTNLLDDVLSFCVVVEMPAVSWAVRLLNWLKHKKTFREIKKTFDSSSSFLSLFDIKVKPSGKQCLLRFMATAGDAVNGKQLVEKGAKTAIQRIQKIIPPMKILAMGEIKTQFGEVFPFSTSVRNSEENHGKSLIAETLIPAKIVKNKLKARSDVIVQVHAAREVMNLSSCGDAFKMGMIATKVVEAVFMATGQDAALIPSSSNCTIAFECAGLRGEDLHVTATMPAIQIGTSNGATKLTPQKSALEFLKVAGRNPQFPGKNSHTFARIICASVLAAELSVVARISQIQIEKGEASLMNPTLFGMD